MMNGFLIYEEMRKYLVIFQEPVSHTVYDFATAPLHREKLMPMRILSFQKVTKLIALVVGGQ
jgi:hypothetical protein